MPRTISDQDRAAVAQNIRHTKIVDASRRLARIVKHVEPDARTKAARTRLEKNLGKWLRFHGGEAFDRPWSADHLKVLAKINKAVRTGGLFALAMPRGHGKTTMLKWVTAYVLLTGARKYVVVIAATAELAQGIVEFIRQQITESDTFHAHYPHVTTYARATDGKAIKARYQLRADGKSSGILLSKTTLVFPEVTNEGQKKKDGTLVTKAEAKPYPSNGAILEAHGLTGAIRGKWKDTKTGRVLRPDFVILDDPQDRSALSIDTPIATPNGFKPMGKINVGDIVFNENGKQCHVLATSPIMDGRECYAVKFDDDSVIVADGDHLWNKSNALQRTNQRRKVKNPNPSFACRPQCKPQPFFSTATTRQIASTLTGEADRNNHSIPLAAPLDIHRRSLLVPPYTLGAWLGDGDTNSGRITSEDVGVIDRIKRDGYLIGPPQGKPNNKAFSYTIYKLSKGLHKIKVFGNKHVPNDYLFSDEESRLKLLQGLMDTDGCIRAGENGGMSVRCSFCNTNHQLIEDVLFLCASLGIKTYVWKRPGQNRKFPSGNTYLCLPSWNVSFVTTRNVFYLSRKASRLPKQTKPSTRRRYIVSVERTDNIPVKCIRVDSPSSLFLCGAGLIPTHNSAESPTQCAMRERIITGDVLGLAGPRRQIAAVMPCTIIRKGDLADRFLDHKQHPEWQGEVCRLVNTWPTAQDTLWREYDRIYREETGESRGFAGATNYYKANRAAMDAGADVCWSSRVRDGELSALQTAENLRIETGPQFWAEYQNDPQNEVTAGYRLEPQQVATHQSPWPKGTVPDTARILIAATDINRAGLHWVIVSFDQQMSAHVCVYGKWPDGVDVWRENAPELERKQRIFTALSGLAGHIAVLPLVQRGVRLRPSRFLIDRGYEPDVVHRFSSQGGFPFALIPARGYAAQKYYPSHKSIVGAPFEQSHVTGSPSGQFVAFASDYWREVMQRAWLGEAGTPGGATLYQSEPRQHVTFSDHLTAEVLRQKYQTDGGMRWEWTHQPGSQWDWADAMSMAYVGAAVAGLNTQGVRIIKRPQREMRQCKVEVTQ